MYLSSNDSREIHRLKILERCIRKCVIVVNYRSLTMGDIIFFVLWCIFQALTMSIFPLKNIYRGPGTKQALHRMLENRKSRHTRSLPSWWKQPSREDRIKRAMTNIMICAFFVCFFNEDLQSLYCYLDSTHISWVLSKFKTLKLRVFLSS